MVVSPRRQRLILPVAPLVAAVVGGVTAAVFALLPTEWLEAIVSDSGIPSIVDAANPPLHATARIVLILGCGGGVGLFAWFALFLLIGGRSIVVHRGGGGVDGSDNGAADAAAPVLRRADAHPDAPARPPVLANRDLGMPFLDVRAPRAGDAAPHVDAAAVAPPADPAPPPVAPREERPLPVDLDQPLSAYDPAAVPAEPLDWFPSPVHLVTPPRRQTFAPTERFETFKLDHAPEPEAAPAPRPVAPPIPARASSEQRADPSETIHALLDRLERGFTRREPAPLPMSPPRAPEPVASDSIEDTLVTLRRLATRGR